MTVSNNIPTAVITNNEVGNATEVTCVNTEISVTASGAGTGGSYSWNNNGPSTATNNITTAGTCGNFNC